MLLKDYLLLHLGRITAEDARRWQAEMAARRRADASRDLLAFWQPGEAEGAAQLIAMAIVDPSRLGGSMGLDEFRDGLTGAVAEAFSLFGLDAIPQDDAVRVGERPLGRVTGAQEDGILLGEVAIDLRPMRDLLGREVPPKQVANALAYQIEQRFGYAPAAVHPVAFEEQMRPGT